jgi:RimJ/RimL family protein N-acetyltransferase
MIDARSYEANETLRTGQPVTIRAIRPEDGTQILEEFRELDSHSLYMRFFEMKKEISDSELKFFTEVDFINHVALVAVTEVDGKARVIGGGRYFAYDHPAKIRSAEVAFLVHDLYQGQGLATLIMKHLLIIARDSGIAQFEAMVLPRNAKMLSVFSRTGLPTRSSRLDDVIHITLSLSPDNQDSEKL